MKPLISSVIVCRHDRREPHQKQKLLAELELKKMGYGKADLKKLGYSDEEIRDTNVLDIAEPKDIKAAHIRVAKKCCDITGCRLPKHTRVARALSQPMAVEQSGNGSHHRPHLCSRITLAEVIVNDKDEKGCLLTGAALAAANAEAKRKAREVAENLPKELTLDILNRIKRPLEHGYTFEQVLDAMKPYVMKHLRSYCNFHFPEEDGFQQASIGIMNAIRTDRAIAPFSNHTFRHIQTAVRREGMTTGLIRHGERDCDLYGRKGGLISEEEGKNIYGSLRSSDAKISEDKELNLYDVMSERDPDPGPLDLLIRMEDKAIAKEKVQAILKEAGLSDQQVVVIALKHGMVGYIDNPYEAEDAKGAKRLVNLELDNMDVDAKRATPKQIREAKASLKAKSGLWKQGGWRHTGTESAKIMGCSRQRIGQQVDKAEEKLQNAANNLGIGPTSE